MFELFDAEYWQVWDAFLEAVSEEDRKFSSWPRSPWGDAYGRNQL